MILAREMHFHVHEYFMCNSSIGLHLIMQIETVCITDRIYVNTQKANDWLHLFYTHVNAINDRFRK